MLSFHLHQFCPWYTLKKWKCLVYVTAILFYFCLFLSLFHQICPWCLFIIYWGICDVYKGSIMVVSSLSLPFFRKSLQCIIHFSLYIPCLEPCPNLRRVLRASPLCMWFYLISFLSLISLHFWFLITARLLVGLRELLANLRCEYANCYWNNDWYLLNLSLLKETSP